MILKRIKQILLTLRTPKKTSNLINFTGTIPAKINNIDQALNFEAGKLSSDEHDDIAIKVYKRLRLRHSQLSKVEEEACNYKVYKELEKLYSQKTTDISWEENNGNLNSTISSKTETEKQKSELYEHPSLRAYHLAVTDLFVEKALAYLEDQARDYKKWGYIANIFAIFIILIGAGIALYHLDFIQFIGKKQAYISSIQQRYYSWQYIILNFTKSFTAYGMLVLIAVGLWRFGKAMLDQSERLMERRHALRQGRLFVHLSDGKLSIEALEKAFNWNMSQNNAFADIKTDVQAPWGAILKELAQATPKIIEAINKKDSEEKEIKKEYKKETQKN